MIDICLLGTGGTVPLPNRWLTSLLVKWSGQELLIDCGEGTQIALNQHGLSCRHIDTILLTHFHADHTAGLPGFLLSMAKADRTEPVTIIGPKGLSEFIQGVNLIARYIPFELKLIEITEREQTFEIDGLKFTSFPLKHSVPCVGYAFRMDRKPLFDKEKALANHVPLKCWSTLQKGMEMDFEGVRYTPDMVLGKQRKGISFTYATDTRPNDALRQYIQDVDLFIGEGMYGDDEKIEKAKINRHMMMRECAELARSANVRRLWFTHYSPSMHQPSEYEEMVHSVFENAVISKDGQKIELSFQEN